MKTTTANIERIAYRVQFGQQTLSEHESPSAAIADAYRRLADQQGKPGWMRAVEVAEIAVHEPVKMNDLWDRVVTETKLRELIIHAPGQLADDHLSYYHPVNGWSPPTTVDIETDLGD